MTSEILNMERKYSVYLPPDYEISERSYPVLYLLHGAGNDHTTWIQMGDWKYEDFLFEGNSRVHIQLRKRRVPHEYRVRDGAHNWTYWRESLPEVLSFVSDTFRGR